MGVTTTALRKPGERTFPLSRSDSHNFNSTFQANSIHDEKAPQRKTYTTARAGDDATVHGNCGQWQELNGVFEKPIVSVIVSQIGGVLANLPNDANHAVVAGSGERYFVGAGSTEYGGDNGFAVSEHGFGLTKQKYLPWEVGERELQIMRDLKRLFDPKGILNPGKQW